MCESTAYLRTADGDEQLVLEEVVFVRPEPGKVTLQSLLGDQKVLEAEIEKIDLMHHKVILRPLPPS